MAQPDEVDAQLGDDDRDAPPRQDGEGGRWDRDSDHARVDEESWYLTTGNGFTPLLYPIFKAMWFRTHQADDWTATRRMVGSKDYVNLRLSGVLVTDHSYASGSGGYSLRERRYDEDLLDAAGLDVSLFPPMSMV